MKCCCMKSCYLSVFTWFMMVSCKSQYQKYPRRKWYLSGVRMCGTRVSVLSAAILEFCTVWEHSTVGWRVATAGTQGNGKPSVSRGYQTLSASFQDSTSSSKPGTCSRVLFCSCMDPHKLLIAHKFIPLRCFECIEWLRLTRGTISWLFGLTNIPINVYFQRSMCW